jgi:hypothetical protein
MNIMKLNTNQQVDSPSAIFTENHVQIGYASRNPTRKEVSELIEYEARLYNKDGKLLADDFEEVSGFIQNSGIAVFENYVSDSPGYTGKVMLVVWPAAPQNHSAYVWTNGKIKRTEQPE